MNVGTYSCETSPSSRLLHNLQQCGRNGSHRIGGMYVGLLRYRSDPYHSSSCHIFQGALIRPNSNSRANNRALRRNKKKVKRFRSRHQVDFDPITTETSVTLSVRKRHARIYTRFQFLGRDMLTTETCYSRTKMPQASQECEEKF